MAFTEAVIGIILTFMISALKRPEGAFSELLRALSVLGQLCHDCRAVQHQQVAEVGTLISCIHPCFPVISNMRDTVPKPAALADYRGTHWGKP